MTKEKFAATIAKEMKAKGIKFNQQKAQKLTAAITAAITEGLERDKKVLISNFGVFSVHRVGAKIINSPRGDKKKFFMPPCEIIKWHPSGQNLVRAKSEEVSDDIFQTLVGNPRFEETEEDLPEELAVGQKSDSGEVRVTYIGRNAGHLSDEYSAISKLVKKLLSRLIETNSSKAEIRPQKTRTEITFFREDQPLETRVFPRDSHEIIIEKLKTIEEDSGEKRVGLISLFPEKILVRREISAFGPVVIFERSGEKTTI